VQPETRLVESWKRLDSYIKGMGKILITKMEILSIIRGVIYGSLASVVIVSLSVILGVMGING
jgi:hypothetical protein